MDIKGLLAQLTLEEKAALLAGTDFMFTNPVLRLNIPSVRMSDGPHGLRVQSEGGVSLFTTQTGLDCQSCTRYAAVSDAELRNRTAF